MRRGAKYMNYSSTFIGNFWKVASSKIRSIEGNFSKFDELYKRRFISEIIYSVVKENKVFVN